MTLLLSSDDDGFVFISKPPGVLSIPGREGVASATVLSLLAAEQGWAAPPLPCHRLDRDTSGVMLLCTTAPAHRAANMEFGSHRVRKSYLALCTGQLRGAHLVDRPLAPDPNPPRSHRGKQHAADDGAPARTVVLGLWTDGNWTLVAARPSTGRTHQVRVHLSSKGHPLVGDTLYGGPPGCRPLLHAAFLSLHAMGRDRSCGASVWPDFSAALLELGAPVPNPVKVDDALTSAIRQM
jgi:23S rRNA-/tRNA-specific pseudouridylate synthase